MRRRYGQILRPSSGGAVSSERYHMFTFLVLKDDGTEIESMAEKILVEVVAEKVPHASEEQRCSTSVHLTAAFSAPGSN